MENETIQLFKVNMTKELDSVIDTLNSGFITQGKKVIEFEDKLKEWFNYPYILTLNSATSGLTLAFRLLNAEKEKDNVLSTPLTCFATNASILANNLKIVWCDTDPNTCNIDLEDVKRRITEKTTILIFVHWGGNIVDLDKVEEYLDMSNQYPDDETSGNTETRINIIKFEMVKMLMDTVLTEHEEIDEQLGIKSSSNTSIPFRLAFNSLLNKKLINHY